MTPAIKASFGWHALMAAGAVALPGAWPWWLGGVAANHAVLTLAGLLPRSRLLGPNITRIPPSASGQRIVLTFDDGPDPALTPWVLDQLEAAGARASFFCIGERVNQHPALSRAIVARGHSIENHSQRHRHHFSMLGFDGFRREIGAAQLSIESATGQRPRFFRAPAGLRNPMLQPVLESMQLQLASWSRRAYDTVRRDPRRIVQRLGTDLKAGEILLLHDGHSARTASGEAVLREVLPTLLGRIREAGLQAVTLPDAVEKAAVEKTALT